VDERPLGATVVPVRPEPEDPDPGVPARDASDNPDEGTDAGDAGRDALARLADELLPALIARLNVSDLGELEVRQGGWRVRLRRDPSRVGHGPSGPASTVHPAQPRRDRSESGPATLDPVEPGPVAATSPAVGYFAAGQGISPGIAVRAGDVIGVVDVLGVRHEVVAPTDGVVGRVLASAGEAVEFGQPLALIEATGSETD
jgi:biotin carboxyl carrier protein